MGRLKAPPARLGAAPRRIGYANREDAELARDKARRDIAGLSLRRLYNTKRWRDPVAGLRVQILTRDNWTCCMCGCALIGQRPAPNSPIVDHIKPHKGNLVLFWDPENLQALCKKCHDGEKQKQDRAGQVGGG